MRRVEQIVQALITARDFEVKNHALILPVVLITSVQKALEAKVRLFMWSCSCGHAHAHVNVGARFSVS